MKSLLRIGVWLLIINVFSAYGQGFGNCIWTNIVAFPTLPSFSSPVCITSPPGETNRLFVIEQNGQIIVVTNLATPTRTVFMDISSKVFYGGESGLLGMAFHPGYSTNGLFYVFYIGNINSPKLTDILSRFQVSALDPNQGDTNSELKLFAQVDRAGNHNGGDLHFGPDGYLYVSVGDEGDEYNSYTNAQHVDQNLFSGILRIDVDKKPGSLTPNPSPTSAVTTNYAIPSDNPFIGATNFDGLVVNSNQVRTEFWAVGLRNPWRFSFDPETGTLYCGDVGQNRFEEVDIISKGGNYGWATYEGTSSPPQGVSTNGQPVAQNPIAPIITYAHGSAIDQGSCIIGGVVYRGHRFSQLYGAYVYGDWSASKVWAIFYNESNSPSPSLMLTNSKPTAFGQDPRNGDILYADSSNVKRVIPFTPSISTITYYGSNLIIAGAGGRPAWGYYLLASTNISLPITNWNSVALRGSDSLANFIFTNPIDPSAPQMFYRIKMGP